MRKAEICGIAVMGLNGSGKSTLAHALAAQTGYFAMDAEDYYFPDQKSARLAILEQREQIPDRTDVLPFSDPVSPAAAERAMISDMEEHPRFILSAVSAGQNPEILSRIDLAVILDVPAEERLKRIGGREKHRFGGRILPGGDLYEHHRAFLARISRRELSSVTEKAEKIGCRVLVLDGTQPTDTLVERILDELNP